MPPQKDLYKILNVSRTASSHEIKMAYRKLAMALHPDKNDGCEIKASEFKDANEAYDTLSDVAKRIAYDNIMSGNNLVGFHSNATKRKRNVPKNYRKVYAPRPPPEFKGKLYDNKEHYEMHYGDGIMKDEVERARRRYEAATGHTNSSYNYQSPLGPGFSFDPDPAKQRNPYSKARQGPPPKNAGFSVEYEEANFNVGGFAVHNSPANEELHNARHILRKKASVRSDLHERRKNRIEKQNNQQIRTNASNYEEQSAGCSIM